MSSPDEDNSGPTDLIDLHPNVSNSALTLPHEKQQILDFIDDQITYTSIFCGTVLALGLFSLRYFRTPASLARRRWALGLATSAAYLDSVYDLHCRYRSNLHIIGRDYAEEYKSTGDIYLFLGLFKMPQMNFEITPENIKGSEAIYQNEWDRRMQELSISRRIYYLASCLWSPRATRAVTHCVLLSKQEEYNLTEEDQHLTAFQVSSAYHESLWSSVEDISTIALVGGLVVELSSGNRFLLRLSSASIAVSIINFALCSARRYQLDQAPYSFEDRDGVAAAFRNFIPDLYK